MGVVKYTGPVASFHCPTEATIRSLKVHFSPKQLGEGDPSPENVREIVGWDGVEVYKAGKNLFNPETVTMNMEIGSDGNPLATGSSNRWCITDFIPVKPNTTYIAKALLTAGSGRSAVYDINKEKVSTKMEVLGADAETVISTGSTGHYVRLTVRIADGLNTTFEESSSATAYESYHGSTTNYEFGVLGKNKFNWNVPSSESSPASSDATTAREFTLDTYVIGMSVNNYYRQNYANWVLNPSVENGVISFSSGGASGYGIAFPLKLAAGQTYFLSGTGNGAVGATYYNEDGELISYQNNRLNKTITVPDNAATTLIGFYANTSNTDFTFSNIQLELGSSATTYEPYNPNKTAYGGWVDLITGEVCEEWGMIVFNGTSESFSTGIYNTSKNYIGAQKTALPNAKSSDSPLTICDKAVRLYNPTDTKPFFWTPITGTYFQYIVADIREHSEITNADEALAYTNTYISENPITVVYSLNIPNTYHLAPTQLQTFLGQNNVWSNADYVEVEYDLHETQDILARKQFIVANQPHIIKPTPALSQNFTTDVSAPLKECKIHFTPIQEGTGDPSPNNVRPITGWTKIETGLPTEYTQVEYIDAENGTPYIDTGFYLPSSLKEVHAEIHFYNDKLEAFLFGARRFTSGNYFNFNVEDNGKGMRFDYMNKKNTWKFNSKEERDGEYFFTFSNRTGTLTKLTTNENWTSDYSTANAYFNSDNSVLLFAVRTGTNASLGNTEGHLKIYSAKFWSGGTYANGTTTGCELVRNFIPCVRKSDDVAGMYDTVTKTFYTSQNSDTFTAGPVINSPSISVDWTNSAGTIYGGYVDLVKGEVWETYIKITLNTSNTTVRSGGHYGRYMRTSLTGTKTINDGGYAISNILPEVLSRQFNDLTCGFYYPSSSQINVYWEHPDCETEEGAEALRSNQDIYFMSVLATPTLVTTLTPTQLKALRGINTLYSNSNGNIELAYWRH